MEYDNPSTHENAAKSNQRDGRQLFQKQRVILVVDGRSACKWGKEMIQPNNVAWPINRRSCVRLEPFFAANIQQAHMIGVDLPENLRTDSVESY
jgi:hypothetical protein